MYFDRRPADHRFLNLSLRLLPMALLAVLAESVPAQTPIDEPPQTVCPIGTLVCKPNKADLFAKCKRNDLLDFYTAGLPPAGDRSKAQTTATANKFTTLDRTHEQLEDDVQLQKLDSLLRSDFLVYDTETTDYVARGRVRYQDSGMLMAADEAHGTTTPQVTILDNARYQMLDQRGNGVAERINQSDPDHSKMIHGTFSTCDPSDRQWELRADDMEIDKVKNQGSGHDVTLAYDGVPFMWFPYMTFPLDEGRATGFLVPVLNYSERKGFKVGFPYYLDLAPNYDMTLRPVEYTLRGQLLDTEFRYISDWDRTQFNLGYMPNDEVTDTSRGYLRLQNWMTFSPNWGTTVDIHYVSDTEYLRDYGDSFQSTAISMLPSSAYLNGHGDWWSTTIGADGWEVTDPSMATICGGNYALPTKGCSTTPTVYVPYARLPHATFNLFDKFADDALEVGMETDYADFMRPYSVTGSRMSIYPHIGYMLDEVGWYVHPTVGYRFTQYDLTNMQYAIAPAPSSASPSFGMPIASVDTGMFFERDTNLFGTSMIQTLEPRLFYLYVPYRNQNGLPNFDTSLPALDFPSLFRTNAYTGGDRQSNANQATFALTSRLLDAENGDQLLSASIGQIRYFTQPRVNLTQYGYLPLMYADKDIVSEVQLRLNKDWSLTWEQQWNPEPVYQSGTQYLPWDHRTDLSSISLQRHWGGDGIINFSYEFRRGYLEQLDVNALIPINQRWSIVGRYYYSLMLHQNLESFAGFQYDTCCVSLRLVARKWLNNNSDLNGLSYYNPTQVQGDYTAFFEIEFKGMGGTGTRTENFLRHAILGYQQ
jgi:LPS-assembly protein